MKKEKFVLQVTQQEIDDILSALSFFISDYKHKAPLTKNAMERLSKRLWKTIRESIK